MRLEWIERGETIRVTAPAKVNLYLEILGERPDGFHELDSLFLALSLEDRLELGRRPDAERRLRVVRAAGGATGAGLGDSGALPPAEDNLVLRAAAVLAERFAARGELDAAHSGLDIVLHKAIPMGGGLGGGSSDAAATLVALTGLWGLAATPAELDELAAGLGSDVPFFLRGGLARCRGRGEIVTPLEPPRGLDIVLVCPRLEVPTPLIYRKLRELRGSAAGLTSSNPLHTMSSGSDSDRARPTAESVSDSPPDPLCDSQAESQAESPTADRREHGGRHGRNDHSDAPVSPAAGSCGVEESDSGASATVAPLDDAALRAGVLDKHLFFNRLQEVAYREFPALERLHAVVEEEPFCRVLLTGSGATIIGICAAGDDVRRRGESLRARIRQAAAGCEVVGSALVHEVRGVAGWSPAALLATL